MFRHLPGIHCDGFCHTTTVGGFDRGTKIDGIHVHRQTAKFVGDLFAGHQQELPGSVEFFTHLRQGFQAHLRPVFHSSFLEPVRSKTLGAFCYSFFARFVGGGIHPLFPRGHHIVFGQREEIVVMGLVPVCNHLGKVIAIAPEGVRVQVSLEKHLLRIGFAVAGSPNSHSKTANDRNNQAGGASHVHHLLALV